MSDLNHTQIIDRPRVATDRICVLEQSERDERDVTGRAHRLVDRVGDVLAVRRPAEPRCELGDGLGGDPAPVLGVQRCPDRHHMRPRKVIEEAANPARANHAVQTGVDVGIDVRGKKPSVTAHKNDVDAAGVCGRRTRRVFARGINRRVDQAPL